MQRMIGLGLMMFLAACGTPQERCIRRETSELRTVQSLLSEVEANLVRGYAIETYETAIPRWEVCGYDEITRTNGDVVRKARMCWQDHIVTHERKVAIDPAAEKRKRDGLVAKRKVLLAAAETAIEVCKTAYPE